ncbi:G patch domain-containing protein 4 [Danaus plexippus]|uniref:G patch domain-containing protein 4 n=1 Tax=Danaus plexippus TaxID=13037 RepID=UPI002AAF119B|nr:G patch domain-containing protein 4 [Danaus plexippus]
MDFARKQLEKYGWTDGKGLGKNENGISEALKPKLKRSVTGIGYDAAQDFTEHWWSALYDKAASNVEVEEKNGKTKKIKQKDNDFEITNSTWKLKKKSKDKEEKEYSEFFIKTAVIDTGGTKNTKVTVSDSDENDDRKIITMTDEELFAACQGRTAHKGARHGLRALGKLARIEQQEKMLLKQTKYEGYSHRKVLEKDIDTVVKDTNLNSDAVNTFKKKKKKKYCHTKEDSNKDTVINEEMNNVAIQNEEISETKEDFINSDCVNEDKSVKKNKSNKSKKRKCVDEVDGGADVVMKDSGDNKCNANDIQIPVLLEDGLRDVSEKPKKKKKKRKHQESD